MRPHEGHKSFLEEDVPLSPSRIVGPPGFCAAVSLWIIVLASCDSSVSARCSSEWIHLGVGGRAVGAE